MVIVQQFLAIVGTLVNTPVMVSLFSIIFLASIGKSLGVRRAYTKVLLKIFEVSCDDDGDFSQSIERNPFIGLLAYTHIDKLKQINRIHSIAIN